MGGQELRMLSPRQRDVLCGLADGKTIGQISEDLNISRRMVDVHLKNAKSKMNAKTKEQALALAVKNNLISV